VPSTGTEAAPDLSPGTEFVTSNGLTNSNPDLGPLNPTSTSKLDRHVQLRPMSGAPSTRVPSTGMPLNGVPSAGVRSSGTPPTGVRPVGVSPAARPVLLAARPALPPATPLAVARQQTRATAPVPVATTGQSAVQRSLSPGIVAGTAEPLVPWRSDAPARSLHRPTPATRTPSRAGPTAAPIQRSSEPGAAAGPQVTFEPAVDEDRQSTADEPPPDLDDLARRLIEPVARLLRAELRRGRERAGRPHDSRR
jgi:syndecan 1